MASLKKLEEEIARSKDPIVREQLQQLLADRRQRRDRTVKDVKEIGTTLLGEIDKAGSAIPVMLCVGAVLTVVYLAICLFMWIF
jgi:hypothetical protein